MIERVILNLSDQQLLTGIAILVSGLIKHRTISLYHFTVISDLAWFSSYVHMTSLILLQDYLRDRPQLRNWQGSLMLLMLNLLMSSTIMEGHWAWEQSWSFAAQCVFDDLMGSIDGISCSMDVYQYRSSCNKLYFGHSKPTSRAHVRSLTRSGIQQAIDVHECRHYCAPAEKGSNR